MNPHIRSFIQSTLGLAKYGIGLPQQVILDLHENKRDECIRESFWGTSRHQHLPPPLHLYETSSNDPYATFMRQISFVEFPSPSTVEVQNTWLYSDSLLFTTPCHTQTILLNGRYQEKALRKVYKYSLKRYNFREIDEPAYLTFDNWANCYYHWLIDTLPRMLAIADDARAHGGVLLLPPKTNSWMREAMEMVGLSDLPTICLDKDTRYSVSRLICPLKMNKRTAPNPLAIELLINAITNDRTVDVATPENLLFVSRNKAGSRELSNEDEFFKSLESLGFVRVFAEDYNFEEKKSLFGNAKCVVGPHGSGLTNILFCKPDTIVIEIIEETMYAEAFYAMAKELGFEYYYALSQFNEEGKATVDIEKFIHALSKLLVKGSMGTS